MSNEYLPAIAIMQLAPKGKGGEWVEKTYRKHCLNKDGSPKSVASFLSAAEGATNGILPINTHGGLLSFGAPWETPAMYNVIESYAQLTGTAGDRQIPNVRRALVYGKKTEGAVMYSGVCGLYSR
jgi:acetyl-CoA acetyltransferase